jgi:hypothetical protein
MNKDPLNFVQRELSEQLNTERTGTVMHEEYGYQEVIKIIISLPSSCLAKERCIPIIANFKLLDLWPENSDFKQGM